jgi:hypothetical protein
LNLSTYNFKKQKEGGTEKTGGMQQRSKSTAQIARNATIQNLKKHNFIQSNQASPEKQKEKELTIQI